MGQYISTQYPGVRFREHDSRKFNGKLDRYFFIRYKREGKSVEEAVGWASNGMNAQKATKLRAEFVQNIKEGVRPQSLREKRGMEAIRHDLENQQKESEKKENFTFGELATRYTEWAKVNKKSWRDDEQRYNSHLRPTIEHKALREITPYFLEKLKGEISQKVVPGSNGDKKKPLAQATVKHCMVLIRQLYNKAIAWGLYDGQNPTKQIKLPVLKNKRLRFLSHAEVNKLLSELQICSDIAHDQTLLSLHCGLRFGEIARLTLADLDFAHGIIQIRDTKGECRQAYMTVQVKQILSARKPTNPTELVFPDRNGNKQKSISDAFGRAVERLGFNAGITDNRDKVVFHTLRHTFASWLAIQGTPIFTIKELMGHKSLVMTERYAHLIPDEKIAAVKKMVEIFDNKRNQLQY